MQAQQLLPKPPQLTWEEAASYGLTYFTAYRMLVDQARIKAGDNVLVWGAGGGLGTFAVQLCALLGANADRRRLVGRQDRAGPRAGRRRRSSTGASSRCPTRTPASASSTR